MYDPTQSGGDATRHETNAHSQEPKKEPERRSASMSISAVLGGDSSPPSKPPTEPSNSQIPPMSLPSLNQNATSEPEERRNSFVSTSNGHEQYSLPPMQFDSSVDHRKQNIPPSESPPLRAEDAVARLKKNQQYAEEDKRPGHHHHHHHVHRHHHHHHKHNHENGHNTTSESPTSFDGEPPKTGHFEVTVSNKEVFDAIAKFPQYRLDSVIYCEQPPDGVLLPKYTDKENCTVQVRIPAKFLTESNEAVQQRKVWGTDIYTDDSDIVAALFHTGHLKLQESDDKKRKTPAKKDCVVTLRIMPKLREYTGSYRNGYHSRTWRTPHDGLSFFVEKAAFVTEGMADGIPSLKKQRLEEWAEQRDFARATYPKVEADDEKVKKFRQQYKLDVEKAQEVSTA